MNTNIEILLVILIAAAAAGIFYYYRRKRSRELHMQFGPEYDRALNQYGNKQKAEAELERRAKRVGKFHIHAISEDERRRFADAWQAQQARFVDQPEQAVSEAHRLVAELMRARGYPATTEFEENADDLSVDHPRLVEHYRTACRIAARRENGESNTEDLRAAMIHYREMFEELLGKSIHSEEVIR